jgi:hypothetical protein
MVSLALQELKFMEVKFYKSEKKKQQLLFVTSKVYTFSKLVSDAQEAQL